MSYTSKKWLAPSVINPSEFEDGTAKVKQDEIFDFMPTPKGFLLVGRQISYTSDFIKLNFEENNLFNTSYRVYTDRLRYFSDAYGRNFALLVEWLF